MNLDDEFTKLLESLRDKIKERQNNGTYDKYDADYLNTMLNNVLDHGDSTSYGLKCPYGHHEYDHEGYPECGWSPSMGYHC